MSPSQAVSPPPNANPDTVVESIERATLEAVCPQVVHDLPGWLLPMDDSTISRAKSAVPLSHAPPTHAQGAQWVAAIEQVYQRHSHPVVFRLPSHADWAPLHAVLAAQGFQHSQPNCVQIGSVAALRGVTQAQPADVDTTPDEAWAQLFLGEGFDAADGASRIRNLTRATGNVYASLRAGEGPHQRTLAGGAAAFSHGWASVHGMRTHAAERGRGLARQVLAGLAEAATARGLSQVFLQVEADNTGALALYRRAGFVTAWMYQYWKKPV